MAALPEGPDGYAVEGGDYSANPDLGSFPRTAPFTYALLAAACLSPEPAARPSAAEAAEVLLALNAEAAAHGSCASLDGTRQVRRVPPRARRCRLQCMRVLQLVRSTACH